MKHSFLWGFFAIVLVAVGSIYPQDSFADATSEGYKLPSMDSDDDARRPLPAPGDVITLDWALNAAISRHPSLRVAWYEIKARQGAAQQAGIFPNPELFGEIEEFGGSGEFSGTDAMAGRIGISQEFLLGGKIGKRVTEADVATKIAEIEHQVKIVETRALVEMRFFNVFTFQERLKLQSEDLSLIHKTHHVVTKRVETGDTSPMDLVRSQVALASAEIELEQTRKALEAARYALAELWGSHSPGFRSVLACYESDWHITEVKLNEALKKSPAWRLLEEHYALADAALDVALVQRIPDIELEGGIQRFNESNDHAYFLEARIPLPFFDRNQGGIAEAKAAKLKSQHERAAGILALRTELQEAWRRRVFTQQAFQSFENKVLPAAQNAYESIRKAYKAGEVELLALLDAQRTWVEARQALLDQRHDLENSRIELKRLIGVGPTVSSTVQSDDKAHIERN